MWFLRLFLILKFIGGREVICVFLFIGGFLFVVLLYIIRGWGCFDRSYIIEVFRGIVWELSVYIRLKVYLLC